MKQTSLYRSLAATTWRVRRGLARGRSAAGRFLMRHWLTVFAAAVSALVLSVLYTAFKGNKTVHQVEQVVTNNQLNQDTVAAQGKVIVRLKADSIKKDSILPQVIQKLDSVVVVAQALKVTKDSLQIIANEATTAAADDAELTRSLTDYRPEAYALPDRDTLR